MTAPDACPECGTAILRHAEGWRLPRLSLGSALMCGLVCEACGEHFGPTDARASVFDGCGQASYQCPDCGAWEPGPPPG